METCECCGAKIITYTHKLNKSLCAALIRAYMVNGLREFKLKDLHISTSQFCNFQKLKYFGLVRSIDTNEGHWQVTGFGEAFIKAEVGCHAREKTYRGQVVSQCDEDIVFIHDVVEGYQWRIDYIREAI